MDRILLDITCILLNFKNIQVAKMYGKMAHFTCIKAQEVNILISKPSAANVIYHVGQLFIVCIKQY